MPHRGKLAPGATQRIAVRFAFKCTTHVNCTIALDVRGVGHLMVLLKHSSALSLVLDPDEIQLSDVSHPIGDGNYAAVYRGAWRSLDVAIKFFKDQHKAYNEFFKFEHEIVVLARLRHPCITRLVGVVIEPGKLSLVMEFAEHGSLRDVLNNPSIALGLHTKVCATHEIFVCGVNCEIASSSFCCCL